MPCPLRSAVGTGPPTGRSSGRARSAGTPRRRPPGRRPAPGGPPQRAAGCGASGEITPAPSAAGSSRKPAWSGEKPSTSCIHCAIRSIIAAIAIAVVTLAGLSVAGLPILTQMGFAAAATVALAVLIALTLLPAFLGFTGQRLRPRRRADSLDVSAGRRWARLLTRRPLTVLLTATVALAALAVPALDLRLGMPDDGSAAPVTTQRKAYDLVTKGFGPGHNGPLLIVVDTKGTGSAEGPARRTAERLTPLNGVAAVTPAVLNKAADTALLTVIPSSAPDSTATGRLVSAIRDLSPPAGATVSVTGRTAINLDISTKLGRALVPYLALIVGLAFLLLVLAFRSILVPLSPQLTAPGPGRISRPGPTALGTSATARRGAPGWPEPPCPRSTLSADITGRRRHQDSRRPTGARLSIWSTTGTLQRGHLLGERREHPG
ncbi:MMPL family transporter [Streptomyces sp. NPDC005283]|uniref:MMPL family transporter n=1 Tax=Streptomyces sp. NPDC005283 TaxID=3156871 RepID=UPI0034517BBD